MKLHILKNDDYFIKAKEFDDVIYFNFFQEAHEIFTKPSANTFSTKDKKDFFNKYHKLISTNVNFLIESQKELQMRFIKEFPEYNF